nr:MAG TPA: hypothetical protein [Caudoviricetes sp.]
MRTSRSRRHLHAQRLHHCQHGAQRGVALLAEGAIELLA